MLPLFRIVDVSSHARDLFLAMSALACLLAQPAHASDAPIVNVSLDMAKSLYKEGTPTSLTVAYFHVDMALRHDPMCHEALKIGSQVSYKLGSWDKLADYSNRWATAFPNDTLAFHYRALAKVHRGQLHEARADYDKSLSLQESTSAYLNRGDLKTRLGDVQGASVDYGRAVQLSPNLQKAKDRLAEARKKLAQGSGTQRLGTVNEEGSSYKYYGSDEGAAPRTYSTAIPTLRSEKQKVSGEIGAINRRLSASESSLRKWGDELRRLEAKYRGTRNYGDDLENIEQEQLKRQIDNLKRIISSESAQNGKDYTKRNNLTQRLKQLDKEIKDAEAGSALSDDIRKKSQSLGQGKHN